MFGWCRCWDLFRSAIHPFTPPHERFLQSTLTIPDGPASISTGVTRITGYHCCWCASSHCCIGYRRHGDSRDKLPSVDWRSTSISSLKSVRPTLVLQTHHAVKVQRRLNGQKMRQSNVVVPHRDPLSTCPSSWGAAVYTRGGLKQVDKIPRFSHTSQSFNFTQHSNRRLLPSTKTPNINQVCLG
jgi:hypothetical protein